MIEILALILLLIRLVSIWVLVKVIRIQQDLMARPIDEEITTFRKHLYWLTLGLAGSNIIPIILDVFLILKGMGVIWTTASSLPLLVVYTCSNAFAGLLAAFLVFRIYRNAIRVDETHRKSDHTLMND